MSDGNYYTVYEHIFPNRKRYIGTTKQNVNQRWKNGNGYKTQKKMYSAIIEYGWNNIEHNIIAENLSKEKASQLERELIDKYNTAGDGGYNTAIGGVRCASKYLFELNNKKYTAMELSKQFTNENISCKAIVCRVNNRGWDVQRAITEPSHDKQMTRMYNGKEYTISELLQFAKTNLTLTDLQSRIERGWDIERALSQPKGTKNQPFVNTYEYKGKYYTLDKLIKFSKLEGLTINLLRDRLEHRKWNVNKALSKPLKQKNKKYEYKGCFYTSKELANMNPDINVTFHTITDRIDRQHWSIEKAITVPLKEQ